MPAGDRSGPRGFGPRTGRGMGYCSGYDMPGWANPGPGYGRRGGGRGRWGGRGPRRGGGGRGWRHPFYAGRPGWGMAPDYAPPSREQEAEMLMGEAEALKEQLNAIQQRIEELGQE